MATFLNGDMWQKVDGFTTVLVTTNNVLRNGELVMGAGAAKQMVERWKYAPVYFGRAINGRAEYGVIIDDLLGYGIFQTKRHFNQPSDPALISKSARMLAEIAKDRPDETFYLNYPGIGLGGLSESSVRPLLRDLPDNVIIWRLP